MNTMTNAMTWDAIAANEGSEIKTISKYEAQLVSGGLRIKGHGGGRPKRKPPIKIKFKGRTWRV